jgi:hypothetical protein
VTGRFATTCHNRRKGCHNYVSHRTHTRTRLAVLPAMRTAKFPLTVHGVTVRVGPPKTPLRLGGADRGSSGKCHCPTTCAARRALGVTRFRYAPSQKEQTGSAVRTYYHLG